MNYLFFDIECANCFNGQGKICSFGYVLCDDKFNVIEQKDILVNPKSRFYLRRAGEEGITLAYEKEEFLKAPAFNAVYETIRKLLQKEDQIIFGHSVGNDLGFIASDCERYKKEQFYIKSFDTQVIYRQMKGEKNDKGLEKLCEEYNIEKATLHRSDYDAFVTMQVLKNLCKEKECTVQELLELYPNSYLELKEGKIIKQFNPTSNAKVLFNYAKRVHVDKKFRDEKLVGVGFALDDCFEETDMKRAKNIVAWIKKKGAMYLTKVQRCNIYVIENSDSERSKKAAKILEKESDKFKIINLEELQKMLNIEEQL